MFKYAVVVVDLLKGYTAEDSPKIALRNPVFAQLRARIMKMMPNMRRLLDASRSRRIPVVFVMHTLKRVGDKYDDGGSIERLEKFYKLLPGTYPAEVYLEGTKWTEVLDELEPQSTDYFVKKNRYSAFYGGNFEQLLRALEVETLIITGIVTNSCVRMTAVDAFCKGWKCIAPKECVETIDDKTQESALRDLSITCDIMALDEVLELLKYA